MKIISGYSYGVWLGLSDIQTEGKFVSLSDARKPRGNFRNWAKGEPNNREHNEHCAMYWTAITLTTANTVPCIGPQ